jgi:hypothetical protein
MTTTNVADRLEVIRHELYKWLSRKAWTRDCVSSQPDSAKILQHLADDMAAAGYPEHDVVGVKVTLEHVIDHGLRNHVAPTAPAGLKISFHVDADRVLVEVEDPRAEQDLQGLFAFRDLLDRSQPLCPADDAMTWVEYGAHNSKFLMLCKHRSPY